PQITRIGPTNQPQSAHSAAISKFVPQRKLHLPWWRGLLILTERQRGSQCEAGVGEIHSIKDVEGLGAETNRLAFFRKLECLLKSKVRIEKWCEPDRGTCACMPRQLVGKHAGSIGISENTRSTVLIEG